jgi:autophagy-related protein 2
MLDLELTALLPTYDACVGLENGGHSNSSSSGHQVQGPPMEELVLRARLLPLRCHVDQHTLDFLAAFFTLAAASASAPPHAAKAAAPAAEAFFQSVHVRRVKVKLDTQTRPLDVREVQRGNYAELLNLCPLRGVKLELAPVHLRGASGWAAVLDGVRDSWLRDVTQKQMHRILMGPSAIRSVFNVGAGMADLVLIPLREYKKDGRLLRGLKKGAVRCLRNITIEALNASVGLTKVVATTLNDLVSDAPPALLPGMRGGGHGDGAGGGGGGGLVGVGVGGVGGRRLIEPGPQPRGVRDGLEHAYDSLSRGLNSAAHTIIAIPIQELERSGPRGSVRAVFRALPIAVVRPVAGATEALSITLLGVRNKIDPTARREEEELWRVG